MNFIKQLPSVALQPFIRHYWMFEISAQDIPFSQLFFPYGSFELICYLHGDGIMRYTGDAKSFVQEKSFYSGQFTKSFELKFNDPCKCVGVSFYPWAGNILYGIPADDFTNQMIPLSLLKDDYCLHYKLTNANSNQELFNCLEEYLLPKLCKKKNDEMVNAITNCIIQKPETEILNLFLNKNIGLTKRRIQQRFLASTGLPMTNFIRKVRFQKSLHTLQNVSSSISLTHLALDSGYYDQSHFINEFKEFAGITPSHFIKQNSELKDFIKSLVIS